MPAVEDFVAFYAARDWDRLGAVFSPSGFERIGQYGDVIDSSQGYIDFLRRVVPTLKEGYELKPVHIAYGGDTVIAELIERLSGSDYRRFIRERVLDQLGLERFRLGVPVADQGDINRLEVRGEPPTNAELEVLLGIPGITLEALQGEVTEAALLAFDEPDVRTIGVPGGGGISTAADIALFYQALLRNPGELWDPAVLASGTREVHGTLPDPIWTVSSNRALGTVIAGDQPGALQRGFGHTLSPRAFGHAGAGGQLAFADPDSGVSFCYLTNGLDANTIRQGRRGASIANYAGRLADSR